MYNAFKHLTKTANTKLIHSIMVTPLLTSQTPMLYYAILVGHCAKGCWTKRLLAIGRQHTFRQGHSMMHRHAAHRLPNVCLCTLLLSIKRLSRASLSIQSSFALIPFGAPMSFQPEVKESKVHAWHKIPL